MSSKETILAAVKLNQPQAIALPDISMFDTGRQGAVSKFTEMLTFVGGTIFQVKSYPEILKIVLEQYGNKVRIVSLNKELDELNSGKLTDISHIHDLHDVEVAILNAKFGVAENGAVWITEEDMQHRVVPFIAQHLVVVVSADRIVSTMHQAYDEINKTDYNFGTFIAGPSKTADIEQSLVIGAHGPRSMTVFVLAAG